MGLIYLILYAALVGACATGIITLPLWLLIILGIPAIIMVVVILFGTLMLVAGTALAALSWFSSQKRMKGRR